MKKVLASLTALLFVVILVACNETEEANEDQEEVVISVETVQVTKGDLSVNRNLYGRITPSSITPVLIQMPGEIDVIEVENGDRVEEDDLIAKLKTPAGIQEIKAPATGEISKIELKEGDIATETDPFAMIIDMDELQIDLGVTSTVRELFKKGETYESIIDEHEYEVKVTSISSMPDDTGLYPVEAVVKSKDDKLLPGMIATLIIPDKKINQTLLLPTEAIIEESDGAYIYVVKDEIAVKTEINILESQSDQTAFEGEVKEGDEVVINGQILLSDGTKVNVVEEGNES